MKVLLDQFEQNNVKLKNQQTQLASLKDNMNMILDDKAPDI